ncbi:bifunctional phosphoglucose/phosphomannose isomerase [Candidatus Saccharibacteria bacterium]|nr:bifunctional phosphoglucose/phosphomannose isomerase [Candidatus Saccharibacteria bacterium]
MLDDLKYIHQKDSQDALGIAQRQWQQLEHKFEVTGDSLQVTGGFSSVVYAGMGGSALAALLSKSWPGYSVPLEVCRQYHVPAYVSLGTLFIAASYSGNTEETLSALAEAQGKGATIVVIASGGQLQEIAKAKSYPFMMIPKVEQPRYAVLYNLKALVTILEAASLLEKEQASAAITQAANFLKDKVTAWIATVPTKDNPAKKLAEDLAGKSVVIYGGPLLAPVAYKWKINFNENAKNVAWWNEFPEFNHNEMIGWSSHPVEKPYGIVELRSNLEHKRVQRRFEVSAKLLSGRRPAPYIVQVEGNTLLEQLLWALAYGDFVSIYLGILNGLNPAPVELVEKFKTELNK